MTSSSDEFEDAIECPGTGVRRRPSHLQMCSTHASCSNASAPNQPGLMMNSPIARDPITPASGHRGRLNELRIRMRNEFGVDETDTPSESTSLASWGRHFLANQSAHTSNVVFANDSASTRGFETQSDAVVSSASTILPCSPPPTHPPPPLPPPPLPPRKVPSKLPPPVLVESRANVNEKNEKMETSADSAALAVPGPALGELAAKSEGSSNSSTLDSPTVVNGDAVRRGHVKTNSLDRGLSLAKVIRAGPFPPNKGNSLTRELSNGGGPFNNALDEGEERERNTDAEDVIEQLTSHVLQSVSDLEDGKSMEEVGGNDGRLSIVEEQSHEAGPSTSTSSAAPETVGAARTAAIDAIAMDNSTEASRPTRRLAQPPVTRSHSSALPLLVKGESTMLKSDPITKDVERRMSIKGRAATAPSISSTTSPVFSDIDSLDTRHGTSSSLQEAPRGMIGLARATVNGYRRIATQIVIGAIQRARTRFITQNTPKLSCAKEEEETEESVSEREEASCDGETRRHSLGVVRPRNAKKGPFDFEQLRLVQELNGEHTGAVWCMRFSVCGRLLATAGQDSIIRVWVLRRHLTYFTAMRDRYAAESRRAPHDALQRTLQDFDRGMSAATPSTSDGTCGSSECGSLMTASASGDGLNDRIFASKPLCSYRGHTADILDLSWSKNCFLLSSGMDRTVKLWHLSRPECLCCFQHIDFVTCIAFLPKDDRYFLSGSLDGKIRLWYIPDKKVALWNEVEQVKFITAMTFVKNGKFVVIGTYNGRCYFYSTDQLKYHTVIDVASTKRGKNGAGHKITGLAAHGDKLLVTSNDSRLRIYDLRDMALTCKLRGAQNERSQIRAGFSPSGRHIVCASEDRYVYLWRTNVDNKDFTSALAAVRKDRNDMWERVRGHTAAVTTAVFAPRPQLVLEDRRFGGDVTTSNTNNTGQLQGDLLVSGDVVGQIHVLVNRTRIRAGASTFFPAD